MLLEAQLSDTVEQDDPVRAWLSLPRNLLRTRRSTDVTASLAFIRGDLGLAYLIACFLRVGSTVRWIWYETRDSRVARRRNMLGAVLFCYV